MITEIGKRVHLRVDNVPYARLAPRFRPGCRDEKILPVPRLNFLFVPELPPDCVIAHKAMLIKQ